MLSKVLMGSAGGVRGLAAYYFFCFGMVRLVGWSTGCGRLLFHQSRDGLWWGLGEVVLCVVLDADGVLDVVVAAERTIAAAQAMQVRALARFAQLRPSGDPECALDEF